MRSGSGAGRTIAMILAGMKTGIAMLALALAVILSVPAESQAQSTICRQLQAQLSALNTGRGSASPKYQQYDRAVREQRAQIQKTERAARRSGCMLFPGSNVCQRISSSLAKMQANLANLQATRDSFGAPGGGSESDRRQVLRALAENRCGEQEAPREASAGQEPPRRRTLLEQIFGVKTYSDGGRKEHEETGDPRFSTRFGTFRTLCVRTCDGYYFPISFSTTQQQFDADLQTCQAMCPGTETDLYVHRMPSEDAEEAISYRTGTPYASLEHAFDYREQLNPECSCRTASGNFQAIAGDEKPPVGETTEKAAAPRLPVPVWRQPAELDPDTMEASLGNFDAKSLERMANARRTASAAETGTGGEKRIRIVGPAFFPVQ